MGNKKIFYVGSFKFPDKNAGARRVYGIGMVLREIGYDVIYLGSESEGRNQDFVKDKKYQYKGFDYYPSRVLGNSKVQKISRLWNTYISGNVTIKRLEEQWTDDTVGIIAYQVSSSMMIRLKKFCSKKK